MLIAEPATVIGRHRRLVAHHWTHPCTPDRTTTHPDRAAPTGSARRHRNMNRPSRTQPHHDLGQSDQIVICYGAYTRTFDHVIEHYNDTVPTEAFTTSTNRRS
jgi:hypothetical protein